MVGPRGTRTVGVRVAAGERVLPCQGDDGRLFFAADPALLERAKVLCQGCCVRAACLSGAVQRREPWGVWGGQLFEGGRMVERKRGRGRPPKAGLDGGAVSVGATNERRPEPA